MVCSTGQHKEMMSGTLGAFGITPDIDLELMVQNQTLAGLSSVALAKIDELLVREKFDGIIVQGDTTTCTFAAVAAFYRRLPVFHIEAGLRSFSMSSPFPEEFNRRVVGLVSGGNFCPTEAAKKNLLNEGADTKDILVTGNTGIDALFRMREMISNKKIDINFPCDHEAKYILTTLHRRESFGPALARLFDGLITLARDHSQTIILPLHLNPNIREKALTVFGKTSGEILFNSGKIILTGPLDYPSFINLLLKSSLIITDSGGIQEEATTLGKRMVICRERTERNEALSQAGITLLNPLTENLATIAMALLDSPASTQESTVFGDGNASARIVLGLNCFFRSGHINGT